MLGVGDTELGGSGAQALHDAALALEAAEAELRLKRVVSVHVGELGESLRQLVRLGLGETVVGGVEVDSDFRIKPSGPSRNSLPIQHATSLVVGGQE